MHDFFIDMDDTLLCEHVAPRDELFLERRLMAVMRDMAVANGIASRAEIEARLALVERQTAWWRWRDLIKPLGIEESSFWETADHYMASRTKPCVHNATAVLSQLRDLGHRLWITSNNPSDGIAHKLRVAGVDTNAQATLFCGFIGTDAAHAMKWDVEFWRSAISIAETSSEHVIVVGDNSHDDMAVPSEAGICRGYLVPSHSLVAKSATELLPGWTTIRSIDHLPAALQSKRRRRASSAGVGNRVSSVS